MRFFAAESRASSSVRRRPSSGAPRARRRRRRSFSSRRVPPREDAEARAATPPPARSASTSGAGAPVSAQLRHLAERISRPGALRGADHRGRDLVLVRVARDRAAQHGPRGRRRVASADEGLTRRRVRRTRTRERATPTSRAARRDGASRGGSSRRARRAAAARTRPRRGRRERLGRGATQLRDPGLTRGPRGRSADRSLGDVRECFRASSRRQKLVVRVHPK